MKSITLTDIIKGIAFTIGLYVVYILFFAILGSILGPLLEKASPLIFIVGLAALIVFWSIIAGFSKAIEAGFSIKDIFGFKKKNNDKNEK